MEKELVSAIDIALDNSCSVEIYSSNGDIYVKAINLNKLSYYFTLTKSTLSLTPDKYAGKIYTEFGKERHFSKESNNPIEIVSYFINELIPKLREEEREKPVTLTGSYVIIYYIDDSGVKKIVDSIPQYSGSVGSELDKANALIDNLSIEHRDITYYKDIVFLGA